MKHVLAGGFVASADDGGKSFCSEIVKDLKEPITILICIFAKPKDTWPAKFESDKLFFSKNLPDKKIKIILASEEMFLTQLTESDVLLLRGGFTKRLQEALKRQKDWQKKFKGSVIAGSSAGANVQSAYYAGLDVPGIHEGLGIVQVKTIVHWQSNNYPDVNWVKAEKALEKEHPKLEILKIPEGEFRVLNT